jgi:hypothetical protein
MAAGMTLAELAAVVPCDGSTVSRVEAGILAPDERFAQACDEVFPQMGGWFTRYYRDSRKWQGSAIPRWFETWLAAEVQAAVLRYWSPIIVTPIFQTAGYARALLLAAQTDTSDEAIGALVEAKLGRAAILDRVDPPDVVALIDELVLHRLIGSPEIMRDQLASVAELARRPYVCVQVVPTDVGATAGLSGDINLASGDGSPDVLHTDATPEGHTTDSRSLVRKAGVAFERIRGYALPRDQSRDLILKVAEEYGSNGPTLA